MREGAYVSVAMDAIIKRLELIMFSVNMLIVDIWRLP